MLLVNLAIFIAFLLLLAQLYRKNRKIRANGIYRFIARFAFWCGIAIRF